MIDISLWEKRKKQIEKKKEEISENRGKRSSILSRLKKEYDVSSVEEAETKLEELEKKQSKLETQLDDILKELEQYEWDD